MKSQFKNDEGQFVNVGTSEGVRKAWETIKGGARAVSDAFGEGDTPAKTVSRPPAAKMDVGDKLSPADDQSNRALEATERAGGPGHSHAQAIAENEKAAKLHHAEAEEAKARGDYQQQSYHESTARFHEGRVQAHRRQLRVGP